MDRKPFKMMCGSVDYPAPCYNLSYRQWMSAFKNTDAVLGDLAVDLEKSEWLKDFKTLEELGKQIKEIEGMMQSVPFDAFKASVISYLAFNGRLPFCINFDLYGYEDLSGER